MPKKDRLYLFKIGGKVIDKAEALESFLRGFAETRGPKILVHGGGLIAEQLATKLGIPSEMHEGRRITSKEMRDLVTMVYGGGINKSIVARLQALGTDAIGLTGADAGLIRSRKRHPQPVDFGYVGDVSSVRVDILEKILALGLTPVFAPLSFDEEILNTNADSIAGALAAGLSESFEVHMMYGFENPGVMRDLKDPDSLITHLDYEYYQTLLKEGVITAGMLPKLDACFKALKQGVESIVLADAQNCLRAAAQENYRGSRLTLGQ